MPDINDNNRDSDNNNLLARKRQQQQPHRRRHRIAMVCDFFHPRLGGVENHIYSLSQHLIRLGHKVIIITHAYSGNHQQHRGVRYLPGPLKVYYCPILPLFDQACLPTFSATLPLFRWIMHRERIEIVHAHQATSTLASECLVFASLLNLATVYTDHSLFGFDDLAGVILNRVLSASLCHVDAAIAVSHTCRDNLRLRIPHLQHEVAVIPNAIDATKFQPLTAAEEREKLKWILPDKQEHANNNTTTATMERPPRVKVVVVSRLVFRKGVDLLVGIVPRVCQAMPDVDFVIAGDGARLLSLQEMLERERLQDRVELLGAVPHAAVRNVLIRGHVFLNCSLTESFCIAILEAAAAGLHVISTNVGGVPEVLPNDLIILADPNVPAMVQGLQAAVERHKAKRTGSIDGDSSHGSSCEEDQARAAAQHERVKSMYSWHRVARETEGVYDRIHTAMQHRRQQLSSSVYFLQRLQRFYASVDGGVAGLVVALFAVTLEFFYHLVTWLQPSCDIEVVPDLNIIIKSNNNDGCS